MNTAALKATENDDGEEVELEEETGLEIEIVDDTPEDDKGRERRPKGAEPDLPDDDEIENYSKGAQKRIKQLKWEFHEERRRADEKERLADEATNFARRQSEALKQYQGALQTGEKALLENAKARHVAEIAEAKSAYKKAFDEGDAEKVADAQERLTRATAASVQWDGYRPRHQTPEPQRGAQQPQQPQQRQQVQPDPEAAAWQAKNPWFGKDQKLSAWALAAHEDIVRSGVRVGSPAYYDGIDKEMRASFPDRFRDGDATQNGDARQRSPRGAQVVAPMGRSAPGSRKKVTLTQTQVALAKRLGLTNQQYAAELIKEANDG